jgi:hypothetical protein
MPVIAASGRLGKRVGLTALAGSNPASSAAPETSSDDRGADLLLSGAEVVAASRARGQGRGLFLSVNVSRPILC